MSEFRPLDAPDPNYPFTDAAGNNYSVSTTQFCPRCEDYAQRVARLEEALRALVETHPHGHNRPEAQCGQCGVLEAARSVLGVPE